jgi:glutamate-5-semialdehyde dehydrogenase
MKKLANRAKNASRSLMSIDEKVKKQIFDEMISNLDKSRKEIIEENQKDIEAGIEAKLSSSLLDRLKLDDERIDQMIAGVREIKEQPEVVGSFYDEFENAIGLKIKKQRIPLGVILMIFESRPNVVIDCAALALKSSNAIILKGGKEAKYSNEVLGKIIKKSVEKYISEDSVIVLASDNRENIKELLTCDKDIDVVVPRGGHRLINYVYENAKMPVIAHFKGLCHMYIDKSADIKKAVALIENAKTQRPGVCNAIETLLIHKDILAKIAPEVVASLEKKGTELRVDDQFMKATSGNFLKATEKDWDEEYLDNILSIKTVDSINEAIEHISVHGSNHSECIVSEDTAACEDFLKRVDASCVMINASTRFNDGGQLGLGAELGISTTKIHAYGPMGVQQMTTSRFVVFGEGQVRE